MLRDGGKDVLKRAEVSLDIASSGEFLSGPMIGGGDGVTALMLGKVSGVGDLNELRGEEPCRG